MAKELNKKRDVLSVVHNATIALANLTNNAATLEYTDNDRASKDFKRDIVNFKNKELKALEDLSKEIRVEHNSKPKRVVPNRVINLENLKQNKNK
jgi:hypothetical protein